MPKKISFGPWVGVSMASLVLAFAAPSVAENVSGDVCGEDEAVSNIYGDGTVETEYSCEFYESLASDHPVSPDETATTTSAGSTQNAYSYERLPGCYPGELGNEDFGDCLEQQEKFCGEDGVWSRGERTRRDDPDAAPEYLGRYCSGDGSSSGGGSRVQQDEATIKDVRKLIPNAPRIHTDNGGRGVRGAHTNIYTDAHTVMARTVRGGREVHLRGIPVQYSWDYGDGLTRITSVPGETSSGFNTETGTSHVFEETGTYEVGLVTTYIGEASYDGGRTWVRVEGTFTIESAPAIADIFRSVTRNVADDCVENPGAWGCGTPGGDSEPTG